MTVINLRSSYRHF